MKTPPKIPRQEVWVYCGDCLHRWVAFYLPMLLSHLGRFRHIACPMCQGLKVLLGRGPAKKAA